MEIDRSKVEKLQRAHDTLHRLLEVKKQRGKLDVQEDEEPFVSNLLLQLESLEKEGIPAPSEEEEEEEEAKGSPTHEVQGECGKKEVDMDEIAREIRRVRKQNQITHCLLTAIIVLVVVWQSGEVAILLTAKERLSHPLRTVGEFFKTMLKGKGRKPRIEGTPLPPIAVPELSHLDLSVLPLNPET